MKQFGRISTTVLAWSVLFFLLLRPSGLVYIFNISAITRILNWACVLVVILLSIIRRTKPSSTHIYYILYFVYMFVVTVIIGGNSNDIYECANMVVSNVGLIFFVAYTIKRDIDKSLRSMILIYGLLLTINLVLMLVYPHGMYNMDQYIQYGRSYWLFGHQNSTITYALPAVFIAFIMLTRKNHRMWRTWAFFTIVVSVVSIFVSKSATSIIGLAIFFVVYFLMRQNIWENILNTKTAILGGAALSIAVVFFQVQYHFSTLFETLFSREATLTGRILIWNQTLAAIKNNWLFGIGYKVNSVLQQTIHGSSAHNEWLYSMLQGGIVLLFLFIMIFVAASKRIDLCRDQEAGKMYVAIYFSLFIQFLVETHMHRIAPLIALLGCASVILNNRDSRLSQKHRVKLALRK